MFFHTCPFAVDADVCSSIKLHPHHGVPSKHTFGASHTNHPPHTVMMVLLFMLVLAGCFAGTCTGGSCAPGLSLSRCFA